jgi:hypothetical protein
MSRKKQVNLNERKELLKEYLYKLIDNKVGYINGKVIRASDLTYETVYGSKTEVISGDVTIRISPYSYGRKDVKSCVSLEIANIICSTNYPYKYNIPIYADKRSFNFISNLNRIKIEKLITALTPLVSEIDKEIAKIEKEEKENELFERKKIIRRLKQNITTKVDFEKLNNFELNQLDKLINKIKNKRVGI